MAQDKFNWSGAISGAYKAAQGNNKNWMSQNNSGPVGGANQINAQETDPRDAPLGDGNPQGLTSRQEGRNVGIGGGNEAAGGGMLSKVAAGSPNRKLTLNSGGSSRRGQIAGTGKSGFVGGMISKLRNKFK